MEVPCGLVERVTPCSLEVTNFKLGFPSKKKKKEKENDIKREKISSHLSLFLLLLPRKQKEFSRHEKKLKILFRGPKSLSFFFDLFEKERDFKMNENIRNVFQPLLSYFGHPY